MILKGQSQSVKVTLAAITLISIVAALIVSSLMLAKIEQTYSPDGSFEVLKEKELQLRKQIQSSLN